MLAHYCIALFLQVLANIVYIRAIVVCVMQLIEKHHTFLYNPTYLDLSVIFDENIDKKIYTCDLKL